MPRLTPLLSLLALLTACRSEPSQGSMVDMAGDPRFAERPYTGALYVPSTYASSTPAPLVVMLHGYGFPGEAQEIFFNWTPIAEAHGFLYAYPTGTYEALGNMKPFWNATDACCNYYGSPVDDSGYLAAMIDDIAKHYTVDPKRVFVTGHSNGGFMAHRMACEHADKIAAIMSLAGAQYLDESKCTPSGPVAVLQVHGDADKTIGYNGGNAGLVDYPSAKQTVATWAKKNGCTGDLTATGERIDLVTDIEGAETVKAAYGGCPGNAAVELWTVEKGGHIPTFQNVPSVSPNWGEEVFAWLSAHPKP